MKRSALTAFIGATVLTLWAAPAHAQATRTWVSGVGDDANSCSRTAPCKTFSGAISKTATSGIINCLDPGGFGALTITKSITIDCESTLGGVLAAGTNGINVAGAGIVVNLRGLSIEGIGTGLVGINITQAAAVYVRKSQIFGFQAGGATGIKMTGGGSLVVDDTAIHTNGTGVVLDGGGGSIGMLLRKAVVLTNTAGGVSVTTSGPRAFAMVDNSLLAFNGGTGLSVNGAAAIAIIGRSTVTGNATGVAVAAAATLRSFKNNHIGGNTVDGTPITGYGSSGVAAHDFDGNASSDIVWRQNTGTTAVWLMNGAATSQTGSLGVIPTTWSIVGQRDFDGNGKHDLLWRDTGGNIAMWFMNGVAVASTASLGVVATSWSVVGTGDFNGDSKGDLVWRDTAGNIAIWLMNGATMASSASLGNLPVAWSVAGVADFNGDGTADLLWRNTTTGDVAIWFMSGTTVTSTASVTNVPLSWSVVGTADFNGDGKADLVWHDNSGNTAIWLMNGAAISSSASIGSVVAPWAIVETGDFDGDGKGDLLWRDGTSGAIAIWFMNGTSVTSTASVGTVPTDWAIQGANAD